MERIDQMIADLREEQVSERQKKEAALDQRRIKALERIGLAADKHLDLEDHEQEDMLEKRLRDSQNVRISQAESMAALAERGDFSSELQWWDVREDGVGVTGAASSNGLSLWKGYVIRKRVARRRAPVEGDYLEVNVREIAEGGFVCMLLGDYGPAIGLSVEKDELCAQRSINRAYCAYWVKRGIATSGVPVEFVLDDDGGDVVDSVETVG